MITLYGESMWDSPWVLTAYVALREKGIDFETRALDLTAGEQSTPGYRDASLTARVPSIDHDGFVLSESQAIVEYLEEAFPAPDFPPLYPDSIQATGGTATDGLAAHRSRCCCAQLAPPPPSSSHR